ncbi:MAG: sensor domain-containing diguanylate cyclase [Dehalococcoidia bacterium]
MGSTPSPALANLPSAFAAACRVSRSDSELFDRCRDVLVRRFHSEQIWLTMNSPVTGVQTSGPAGDAADAIQVAQLASGESEVTIKAEPSVAEQMGRGALPLAMGLSVVLELRGVLLERQATLDDAVFQLRALRQVARLLSSVHSSEETERLILDFMAEVFFTRWACLYRPSGKEFVPAVFRSRDEADAPSPIPHSDFENALPPGSLVTTSDDVAIASLLPAGTELVVPLDAGAERLAVLVLGPGLNERPYGRAEHELAGTLAFAAAIALKNAELVERLHSAATSDGLTGLYNRRALEERLEAELSRAVRHELHTSIVLIDIDRFKPINDTLGHAAGDRLLILLAETLQQQCRTLDTVGRLGGDEFLVVLPMTSSDEAMVFVRRVQKQVKLIGQEHPEFGNQTVSLGIGECPRHGANVSTILAAADRALYHAKRSGRNTVAIADETS